MALHRCVTWLDPGDMTGIARLENGRDFHAGEYPFQEACERIHALCAHWRGGLAIGWERYVPSARRPQTHAADAMGIIGVARYLSAAYGCVVLPPAQQHTPRPPEQARLKAINWWKPNEDDSQSAACHLLNYLLRSNLLPPAEAAVLAAARAAR